MKLLQDTRILAGFYIVTLLIIYQIKKNKINILDSAEKMALAPLFVILMFFIQHTNASASHVFIPDKVRDIVKTEEFAIVIAILSTFYVTKDIEITMISTISYLLFLQLIRTKEERKEYPFLGFKKIVD